MCGAYGFIDDKYALPVYAKLAFQLASGVAASLVLGRIEAFSLFGSTVLTGALSAPLTALWVAFMMNAVNLTDGLDGLCAGTSAVSAACLSLLHFAAGNLPYALFSAALSGGCLGFLFHNIAPAKIFMGETGSAFLGFMLAVLSLPLFSREVHSPLAAVLPAFLLPLCEAAGSFLRRAEKGKNPFAPDKEHMHHVLFARLGSAPAVCAVMYALALVGAIAALIYERAPAVALLLLAAATVCIRLMLSRTSTLSLRRRREPRAECRGRQGQRRAR
jgi:UDP-GlcNAc:undecaprenyl-phosphate GlcNAc-1-phosphate transferase